MSEETEMNEREGLAAEYVLGTLPLSDRAEAERLIARDPAFAAIVDDWEDKLAPLTDGYAEIPAPADLLDRVEARLFPAAASPARSWRPFWLGLFGGLAVAGLAAFVILPNLPGPGVPPVVATLTGEGQDLIVTASYAPGDGKLTVTRTGGATAASDKDYQLWLIPAGQAPVPLGLIRDAALEVPVEALPPGTTLAVSLEPTGGSPTGQPTGPVLIAAVIAG
jgi:anti-sigma-K factor RskA